MGFPQEEYLSACLLKYLHRGIFYNLFKNIPHKALGDNNLDGYPVVDLIKLTHCVATTYSHAYRSPYNSLKYSYFFSYRKLRVVDGSVNVELL